MSDYVSIMMREQAAARSQYNFDPRQRLASSRPFLVETFNSTQNTNVVEVNPDDYAEQNVGSRSDESSVQATPETKAFKKYIIIDSSQRDWVKQPNPYSNLVFTFGSQSVGSSFLVFD